MYHPIIFPNTQSKQIRAFRNLKEEEEEEEEEEEVMNF